MVCKCLDNLKTMDRLAYLLEAVKQINLTDLEPIIQQAHECDSQQIHDPAEPFPVTRQALRMFWMFRRHLETVDIRTEVDE